MPREELLSTSEIWSEVFYLGVKIDQNHVFKIVNPLPTTADHTSLEAYPKVHPLPKIREQWHKRAHARTHARTHTHTHYK